MKNNRKFLQWGPDAKERRAVLSTNFLQKKVADDGSSRNF